MLLCCPWWRTIVQFSPRQCFSSWINFVNMPCSLFHQIGFKGSFNLIPFFKFYFIFIDIHSESDVICFYFSEVLVLYFYHDVYSGEREIAVDQLLLFQNLIFLCVRAWIYWYKLSVYYFGY